jgi:hypothetical protein
MAAALALNILNDLDDRSVLASDPNINAKIVIPAIVL